MNFGDVRKLDIDAIKKAGHDGIVIKDGRYGPGGGQEDLAQGIVFNPTKKCCCCVKIPEPTNLTTGETVKIKQPLAKGYTAQYPQLQGVLNQTHKVVGVGPWGHLEIKVGGKRIAFRPEDVEFEQDIARSPPNSNTATPKLIFRRTARLENLLRKHARRSTRMI